MTKIVGAVEFRAKLNRIASSDKIAKIDKALFAAGSLIEVDAALSITKGSASRGRHVPSKPGEPPNADTHLLDRSITTQAVGPLKVQVAADTPYAAALEYGTSKMQPRPFMRPALARKRGEASDLVRDAIQKVIDGA